MSATSAAVGLRPISMQEAVGYSEIEGRPEARVAERLVLKYQRLFLLLDPQGAIAPAGSPALGLYFDDTRILSAYELRVAGSAPTRLSSEVHRMSVAQVDLAVSDAEFGGEPWTSTNRIHIRRQLLLDHELLECLTVTSYLTRPVDYWIEIAVGCDFADIFEVRGWKRAKRGTFYEPAVTDDAIEFRYRGRDGMLITSRVRCFVPPTHLSSTAARWAFRLEPAQSVELRWAVTPASAPSGTVDAAAFGARRRQLETDYETWRDGCARWRSDVAEFNSALARASEDLFALYTRESGHDIITAGIPWYSTPFGRDSIITSLQTLGVNPAIAIDTLRYLAYRQGVREDAFTEEQPGKIMHEIRRGEMARAREIPFIPYYGTVDATPLWLILLHEVWRWTGDLGLVRALLPNAERALTWIDRYGDMDGDGFVEYAGHSPHGLVNQGWKDSHDGVPWPDGSTPQPPIALVEVQGYVYDAKARMASLYEALGDAVRARALREQADALRANIEARFWLEDLGTYALALDGAKRPVPTVTSNAGHLLWCRVPEEARTDRVAHCLFGSDMFAGWGVRTLSARHPVYNPMSYHDGSIWPHDNALIALGLSLQHRTDRALTIAAALHDAASVMPDRRLPELYCGMDRRVADEPVQYPVSCSPQAWASGSVFMVLQGLTGLLPDAPDHRLHIREPLLPPFLKELAVHGLVVGGSRVSLQFLRERNRTMANVIDVEGDPLRVVIEL